MSIRATVDGQNYNGITKINAGGKSITLSEQGTIATPTATKDITANGTYDVTNFAQAIVNVATGGASESVLEEFFDHISSTTHTEDWITDEKGNAENVAITYIPTYGGNQPPLTIVVFKPSDGVYGEYDAKVLMSGFGVSYNMRGINNVSLSIHTSRTFHIKANTKVDVYQIKS